MGSGEDDSEDVGVRRTQASSPASVLMVNTPLSPSQRPLRASLTVSVSILMGWYSRNLTGGSHASSLTCLSSFSIDDLIVVILLECEDRSGEDGAQATSEVSEDTTTTIVNVSYGYGIGALRGPGDRFEDEGC